MEIRGEDVSVVEAVGKDDVHAALTNVRVEPGRLVATDGRMLVMRDVRMEEGEAPFEAYLLEAKALKAAAGKGGYLYAGENGTARVRSGVVQHGVMHPNGTETMITKADGTYPEYSRVVPPEEREGQKTAQFDPALLARLLKAFHGVGLVRLSILDGEHAVRVDGETGDGRKVVGVIMPMRK